jgi:hypothetical protein
MNQHEWVAGCQSYYRENYLEPGNPEDGEWHDCHYPTPKCLGGTNTVKLLVQHHAVHGILQSEEYNYPCIYTWESAYLPVEYLPLYDKWITEKHRLSSKCKLSKRGIAFELLPTPSYHTQTNHSTPKPILIHYIDGSTVYAQSIKHASRITNVPQSTIQRRIKLSVQEQLPE